MGRVVALMDDLFFQMKLAETAKQLGVEVKVAANAEALMGLMASEPKLVIVDLKSCGRRARASAWSASSRTCKESLPPKRRRRDAMKFFHARVSRRI